MTPKRLILSLAALLAVAGALAAYRCFRPSPKAYRYRFGAMGTLAQCVFFTSDRACADAAFDAVKREFDHVTRVCSLHDPASELSRLNCEAGQGEFRCSPLLWTVLTESRRAYRVSSGAFDITVKPLMDTWGFYRKRSRLPDERELSAARELVGLDKVEWDDARRTVRFRVPGMAFDLGGVAKGYALDLAAAAVRKLGVESGVIDLGGNLYLLPKPPPGKEHYHIGIRSPSGVGDSGEILELDGPCAVSTSGSYERFVVLEGQRRGHVVDPATGEAPFRDCSVTTAAPTGIESDWMSSAAFLRGAGMAGHLERSVPGSVVRFTAAPACKFAAESKKK